MQVSDLTTRQVQSRLKSKQGLVLRISPFVFSIRSNLRDISENLKLLYADYSVLEDEFVDFYVQVKSPRGIRSWLRPQVLFYHDGMVPFKPLPLKQAYPMLEWGMNFCVSNNAYQYLIIHAAVVEKQGQAVILPAPPGSGKSTFCAALVHSGWRLMSDELALVSKKTGEIHPFVRPVSLKNKSIDVIKTQFSDAMMGQVVLDTLKGTVAHMRPPAISTFDNDSVAMPAAIVFPQYRQGSPLKIAAKPKGQTFMELIENCFNYSMLGEQGFDMVSKLVSDCRCYTMVYSEFDEALAWCDDLVASSHVTKQ